MADEKVHWLNRLPTRENPKPQVIYGKGGTLIYEDQCTDADVSSKREILVLFGIFLVSGVMMVVGLLLFVLALTHTRFPL